MKKSHGVSLSSVCSHSQTRGKENTLLRSIPWAGSQLWFRGACRCLCPTKLVYSHLATSQSPWPHRPAKGGREPWPARQPLCGWCRSSHPLHAPQQCGIPGGGRNVGPWLATPWEQPPQTGRVRRVQSATVSWLQGPRCLTHTGVMAGTAVCGTQGCTGCRPGGKPVTKAVPRPRLWGRCNEVREARWET